MLKVSEREKDAVQALFWLVIMLVLLNSLTACGSWQGMEFKVGIGNYNSAQETKSFVKEGDKK